MDGQPDPPTGSRIEVVTDPGGVTLRWLLPVPGRSRYVLAAVYSCGFVFSGWAWVLLARHALFGDHVDLCTAVTLGVWTWGVYGAAVVVWLLLRPSRPESVRLEANALRYRPGRAPLDLLRTRAWWERGHPADIRPSPAVDVRRTDIAGFTLDRVGGRPRLFFEYRGEVVEVGPRLAEADREWLCARLRLWLVGGERTSESGAGSGVTRG